MQAARLLSELLMQRLDKVPVDSYSHDPGFADLKRLQIIQDAGLLQSVQCEECCQAHDAPVEYDDSTNSYGWYCYEHGFLRIERDRLRAFRVCVDEVVARLSRSLSCRNTLNRPLVPELLWRVGVFEIAERDIAVYLATGFASLEDAQRCASAISSEARRSHRLLLTPNLEHLSGFDLAGCSLARLEDAISIDPTLGVDARPYRLAQLAEVPFAKSGGRRSLYEPMLSNLIAERDKVGLAEDQINSESRAIGAIWPSCDFTEEIPSESTVKRAVFKYRGGS